MKQSQAVILSLGITLILGLSAVQTVQAQLTETNAVSDFLQFGSASNPGGFVGFIQAFETNASEFYPAFLPSSGVVPDNVGIQLLESGSSAVSDQLWTQGGFWYFASDPNLIDFASTGITDLGNIVETGNPQDVSGFFSLPANSMLISSDVPEPGTLALAALGGLSLLRFRRQRK